MHGTKKYESDPLLGELLQIINDYKDQPSDDKLEELDQVLDKGANPEQLMRYGERPISIVVQLGLCKIVEKFIERGTDPNNTRTLGVFEKGEYSDCYTATLLHIAVQTKNLAMVNLLKNRVDQSVTEKSKIAPLHLAIDNGSADIVKELIGSNADISGPDLITGRNACEWASQSGYDAISNYFSTFAECSIPKE